MKSSSKLYHKVSDSSAADNTSNNIHTHTCVWGHKCVERKW